MNVTRRNNGLAITGTDNEIVGLLASLETGFLMQSSAILKALEPISDATGRATRAEIKARYREIKRLRQIAEKLQEEADAKNGLQVEPVVL